MSFRHLNQKQNEKVSDLLLAGAKAIGFASLLAVLFPGAGQPRPVGFAVIGMGFAVALAIVGVRLLQDKTTRDTGNTGPRRRT